MTTASAIVISFLTETAVIRTVEVEIERKRNPNLHSANQMIRKQDLAGAAKWSVTLTSSPQFQKSKFATG